MLEGPKVGFMLPGAQDVLEGDQEAQEVFAYARSYAGKLEAQREAEEKEEKNNKETVEQEETLKLAEDKKRNWVENQELSLLTVAALSIDIPRASMVDEEKNQLGPSRPNLFSLLDSPSTPRPAAQKVGQSVENSIPEAKKLKPTIEKLTDGHKGVDPDPKRAKQDPEIQHERRNDGHAGWERCLLSYGLHHWGGGVGSMDQAVDELPDALWSNALLDRVPPEPPKWIEDIVAAVEEARLQKLGVLSRMDKLMVNHKTLTTRFVRDWRAKHRDKEGSGPKQWLRRSRLVAREYATDKRDDIYAPATGGQALRLLPLIYLGKKAEEAMGGEKTILGSLDVKDIFLQVKQEVPTQVITATGHFEVLRNLPGQRIGAKAWLDHLTE